LKEDRSLSALLVSYTVEHHFDEEATKFQKTSAKGKRRMVTQEVLDDGITERGSLCRRFCVMLTVSIRGSIPVKCSIHWRFNFAA
jgi:hypothetical protein